MEKQNMARLFTRDIAIQALKESFIKLNPAFLVKNPVIFIVGIGAVMTTVVVLIDIINGQFSNFNFQITIWLWFTVLFANFAEAVAEGRGKAQADSLRKNRTTTKANKLVHGNIQVVLATELKKGDETVCSAGDIIPADGDVIQGIASVDESAITGESAPVIRESGGDRSAVTGGTKVISDQITIRITSEPGFTFLDRIIALVEGAKRQKTPNEIALIILLSGLTIIFLLVVISLPAYFGYSLKASGISPDHNLSLPVLIALLVCLIPTTIG
jgi:potassium-transporting ATPase ATP-binding subunit